MTYEALTGYVVRSQSGFYHVQVDEQRIICRLRGRLKKGHADIDLVAVGDIVHISLLTDGSGVIEEVEPRHSALIRSAPTARGVFQQVLVANLDQVALVFACAHPPPHLRMLDRFLVICEKQGLQPLIVVNKTDLVRAIEARNTFSMYPPLGYPVVYTSTVKERGIEALRARLLGKVTGIAGPSGVGKTSLLNAIEPNLDLAVREINKRGERGRHTTVAREMFPLTGGGFVVDLPGLRSLTLWDTQAEELDGYFPELRDLVADCQFNNCTHTDEPGCAVVKAVEDGRVHADRYESYVRLRFGDGPDRN